MIHKLYSKWVRVKLFSKILILYTTFTIAVLLFCSIILSNNFGNLLLQNEKRYINLTIDSIEQYFNDKKSTFSNMLVQMYVDSASKPEITEFLQGFSNIPNFDNTLSPIIKKDEIKTKSLFSSYMKSCISRDRDIEDILIYTLNNQQVWAFTEGISRSYEKKALDFSWWDNMTETKENRILVTPAQYCFYNSEYNYRRVFRISTNLKKLGTTTNVGMMLVGFETDSLGEKIERFANSIQGNFLVLTSDGYVVYDLSGKNYDRRYDYYDTVTKANLNLMKEDTSLIRINDEDYYLFTSKSNDLGLLIVGLFPRNEILRHANSIKVTVTTIIILSILLLLIMINISTYFFSKRVRVVTSAMKKVRSGDLSVRIPIDREQDELGEISQSFNTMCDSLKDYIDRVYLYEIKQKNAEFKLLQSQINPHFLYNTLSAIQMKSLAEGGNETAQMIYALADLFRMVVKKETVIKINDELNYCEKYMELFKLRYKEKLEYVFSIDREILWYGIPRHFLQPILENYLIHGIDSSRSVNIISIHGYYQEKNIIFEIADNGVGIDNNKLEELRKGLEGEQISNETGIGLSNVNDRIKIIYGRDYGIEIKSDAGKGTTVILKLQALSVEGVNRRVQGINS